jgi:hypothetical protein
MGLLNKLQDDGSAYTDLDGGDPTIPIFSESKLHYTYSINGDPTIPGVIITPSELDLDGVTPPRYTDNPPL